MRVREPSVEPLEGEERSLFLRRGKDFETLKYESVESLHRVVTADGFFEDLAYRLGRKGKPEYRDIWAFDPANERRERWRLMG